MSSGGRAEKKQERRLDRARKLMLKNDSEYAAFLAFKSQQAEEDKVKKQGEMLAKALQPALVSALTQAPSGQQAPGAPSASKAPDPSTGNSATRSEPVPTEASRSQVGWLNAELGASFKKTGWTSLEKALTVWAKAKTQNGKALANFVKTFGDGSIAKADRPKQAIEILRTS